jgi:hypothetical protein
MLHLWFVALNVNKALNARSAYELRPCAGDSHFGIHNCYILLFKAIINLFCITTEQKFKPDFR